MSTLLPQETCISELLRLRIVANAGDDVLAYIDERREQLQPDQYKGIVSGGWRYLVGLVIYSY